MLKGESEQLFMKLIKKINNNYAIAKDSSGKEVIVSGRGIGFNKMPTTLADYNTVDTVYYGVSSKYISFLSEISEEIINVSEKIVEYAMNTVGTPLNPNFLFTLADHTDFSIKRAKQGVSVDFSMTLDFKLLYKKELEVGYFALKTIKEDMGIDLPEKEAYGFAINLVNAEMEVSKTNEKTEIDTLIQLTATIIENYLDFEINRNTDNYERFELHLKYLYSNMEKERISITSNETIFQQMCQEYPRVYECVHNIKNMLYEKKGWQINNDELLYMMLHINRLYFREQHSKSL